LTKRLIAGVLAAAAVAASASIAGAATHHSCGSLGGEFLHIRTTNTTCNVAKNKVIFYTMQGEKPPGWRCTSKKASKVNTDVTCKHSGGEAVAYVYHA
jgi:hypothetical protein